MKKKKKNEKYKNLIDDLKNNERRLEEELSNKWNDPFIQQAEERGNVFRNIQIAEKKLKDTERLLEQREKELQENEVKLRELEKENRNLKENYARSELKNY